MLVTVISGTLPAMSTMGVLTGRTEDGKTVTFGADHRLCRDVIEALQDGDPVECLVEDWLILSVTDPGDPDVPPVMPDPDTLTEEGNEAP